MGTTCDLLLADLFVFTYECDYIAELTKTNMHQVRKVNLSYRYPYKSLSFEVLLLHPQFVHSVVDPSSYHVSLTFQVSDILPGFISGV
jgi:hypothetical protein